MKTISISIVTFIFGIGMAFMCSLVWWQSHPKIVEVPEPYPVVEYRTIIQMVKATTI